VLCSLCRHLQATPLSLLNKSYLALHEKPLPCTRSLCCLVTKTVWEGDFDGPFVSHAQGIMTYRNRSDGSFGHGPCQKWAHKHRCPSSTCVTCNVLVRCAPCSSRLTLTSSSESMLVHLSNHRTSITAHQSHALWSLTSHTTLPPEQFTPSLARGTRTSAALSPKLFGRATLMVRSCHTDKVL